MKTKDVLLWTGLYGYFVVYIFICLALGYIVSSFHILLSIPSIIITSFPFLVFMLIVWIIYKFTSIDDRKGGKRELRGFIKIGTIPVLILLILIGVNERDSKFDVERWAKDADNRGLMVEHLLAEYELVGKTRKDIVELLGEGEYQEENTYNEIRYYLGTSRESFIPIDPALLVITFDENNKVVKCDVQVS